MADKKTVYYYGFYRVGIRDVTCVITYGLREGLKWQVKGFRLCSWGETREGAEKGLKEMCKEKGYKM